MNHCEAGRQSLENRMRTQDWFHDLSDQETVTRSMLCSMGHPDVDVQRRNFVLFGQELFGELKPWFAQFRQEAQANGLDYDAIHQRIHRFMAEHQRREANSRSTQTRFVRQGEWMANVDRERARLANQLCNSIGAIIDKQKDIRDTVQSLAQQIDAIRSGTHPGDAAGSTVVPEQESPEDSAPAFLEIEDLKRKVARLIEQVSEHAQDMTTLKPLISRVDLAENRSLDGDTSSRHGHR